MKKVTRDELIKLLVQRGLPADQANLIPAETEALDDARLILKDQSASDILVIAFIWRNTKEGFGFWESIFAECDRKEQLARDAVRVEKLTSQPTEGIKSCLI